MTFYCSFGYEIVKVLVKGQGGLPNCIETRLDIPSYVEQKVRAAYTEDVVSNKLQVTILEFLKLR